MNTDERGYFDDAMTERVPGAIFEVSNTLGAGLMVPGLVEIAAPALDHLGIEAGSGGASLEGGCEIPGSFPSEPLCESFALGVEKFLNLLVDGFDAAIGLVPGLDGGGVGERVLVRGGVIQQARERVIIARRDRVVLVVVAARAGDGGTEEAAGEDVDAVVQLIGAGFGRLDDLGVPGAEREESQSGPQAAAGGAIEKIAGDLRFREQVEGQLRVPVGYGLDQQAFRRLSGQDGGPELSAPEQAFAAVEAQTAELGVSVAGIAVPLEQRPDRRLDRTSRGQVGPGRAKPTPEARPETRAPVAA